MLPTNLDLTPYQRRIELDETGPPSLTLLRNVIARHTAAIPFENLDIILGRPIRLDIGSIQAKLVHGGRGGYCFEQNTLLRAALEQMGFRVTTLMARVVRSAPADAITPRTHMLLRVDLPEGPFLADAGFGNLTPTAPLMLNRTDPQPTRHEHYRLQPLGDETLLQARLGEVWENIYRFSADATFPIDQEVANWFTSTNPDSFFTTNAMAAMPGPNCRKTLFNSDLTLRDSAYRSERSAIAAEPALRDVLRTHFGINLSPADLAGIHHAMRAFSARPGPAASLD